MNVRALLVVPPPRGSERNARTVGWNSCSAVVEIGLVNASTLSAALSKRRPERRLAKGNVVVRRARAVESDSYTAVVLQPANIPGLVILLD